MDNKLFACSIVDNFSFKLFQKSVVVAVHSSCFGFMLFFCVPFLKNNLGVNLLISHNLTKIKGCCEQKLTKLILESHNCQTDGNSLRIVLCSPQHYRRQTKGKRLILHVQMPIIHKSLPAAEKIAFPTNPYGQTDKVGYRAFFLLFKIFGGVENYDM